ncbi:cytochrome P450 [Kitasatospora sp. NPDC049258]|uniref:cytochrome P450 n=1 Tax=Kitasatospora sp. NPDC049258 TaxID=3155394 RepID=UPI00343B44E0
MTTDTPTARPGGVDPDAAAVASVTVPSAHGSCPFDPPPAYREAHQAGPITRIALWDGAPCWLLTGYRHSRAVLADNRFSADARLPGFPFITPGRRELVARTTPTFLRLDDPEHARQRRMLTGDFIIKRVEALRPQIQQIVDEAFDRMIAKGGPADLVQEFALPVPSLVICLLLGVPYEDHEFFQEHSRILLDISAETERVEASQRALTDYLGELADRKLREPDDGVLSRLVARGELSRAEAASMGLLLLIAGHETTANMTALGTLALLSNPAQLERLRAQPELMKGAVEELLRYLTIVHLGIPRVALEDVELDGTVIRAGEGVLCMVSTANRDSEQFEDGDALDVTRDARRHLAFGFGIHQCLGQPLARAELQIALATLLRRLPNLRLAVPFDQVERRTESVVHGLRALPVDW